MNSPTLELRVAITAADYDRVLAFYTEALGLDPLRLWTDGEEGAVIFEMGRGTLEIFDDKHAATVDQIEVGQRVTGQFRFALQVPDLDAALARAKAAGAKLVHEPIVTPWGHRNARLEAPDGLQITLYQASDDGFSV